MVWSTLIRVDESKCVEQLWFVAFLSVLVRNSTGTVQYISSAGIGNKNMRKI